MGFWPSRPLRFQCCYCSLRCWRSAVAAFLTKLRDLAPYAALELVMPGGSVMALLLWLYRRRKQADGVRDCRRDRVEITELGALTET